MSEKDKYYTPSIEELLTILINEKQIETNEGYIIKIDRLVNDLSDFLVSGDVEFVSKVPRGVWDINPNLYRVKFLNKEDIEDLGFVKKFDHYVLRNILLRHNIEDNYVYIEVIHTDSIMHFFIFQGTIKNKSELKRIMYQLGIL